MKRLEKRKKNCQVYASLRLLNMFFIVCVGKFDFYKKK